LPKHAQDIWVSAYNSAFKQYKGDESKANATAWSAVKKAGYVKKGDKWSKMSGETTASSLDPEGKTISVGFAGKKKKKKDKDKKQGQNKSRPIKGEKKKMKKMSKFVKWSTKAKGKLPDSAFAIVYKEGDKTIRKLPYKDANGKVDVPHLRNALVRVAQKGTDLTPTQRARAKAKLTKVAKRYLKTYKETKSGEIIGGSLSKFASATADKLTSIIDSLKKLSQNLKPEEEVSIEVKKIAALIQDLEEVVEEDIEREKLLKEESDKKDDKEEDKDKKEEADTEKDKEEKDKKEDKESDKDKEGDDKEDKDKKEENKESDKEEDKDKKDTEKENKDEKDDDEEESKFQQLIGVCEGYKEELKKSQEVISKLEKRNDDLSKESKSLSEKVSKFEKDSYEKLLNNTVDKISKFKRMSKEESLSLKQRYLVSKMSVSALEELGRITDDQMLSKLEEPKQTTKPSQMLEPAEENEEYSKMSKEAKLDALAKIQAKEKGFVE